MNIAILYDANGDRSVVPSGERNVACLADY